MDTLTRPIGSLVYLCEENENVTFNLDPFEENMQQNISTENEVPEQTKLNEEESSIANQVVNNMQAEEAHAQENIEDVTSRELNEPVQNEKKNNLEKGTVKTLLVKYAPDQKTEKVADLAQDKKDKKAKKKP